MSEDHDLPLDPLGFDFKTLILVVYFQKIQKRRESGDENTDEHTTCTTESDSERGGKSSLKKEFFCLL